MSMRETVSNRPDGLPSFDFIWDPSTRTISIKLHPMFYDSTHSGASQDPEALSLRDQDVTWICSRIRQVVSMHPDGSDLPSPPTFAAPANEPVVEEQPALTAPEPVEEAPALTDESHHGDEDYHPEAEHGRDG